MASKSTEMALAISAADSAEQLIASIETASNLSDVLAMIKQIKKLKLALDAVGLFHSQAVKYAKLEATALVKCVELGGLSGLRGIQRKTAEWLAGLSAEERAQYISMCEEGLTIEQVYKREVGDSNAIKAEMSELCTMREEILSEVNNTGIVDTAYYWNKARKCKALSRTTIEDWIDGTRSKLRSANAVGIGKEDGVYVKPNAGYDDEVKKAILSRWGSIVNDMRRLIEISRESKVKLPYKEFESQISSANRDHLRSYIIHFLIGLARAKVIEDESALMNAIGKSEASIEVEEIEKILRVSKDEALKIIYKRFQKQKEAKAQRIINDNERSYYGG